MRIAKAKVLPPRKAVNILHRTALKQREDELDSVRMVIVEAPAGFGKTTAMMQLVEADRRMGNTVIWLTLDDNDNDVSRFLRVFSLAINSAKPESTPPGRDGSGNAELANWIIDSIEDAEQPASIYFDNFEVLRNPVVIGLIIRGTNSLPPGSRSILGTRKQTELDLAKLRAKGELIEFTADNLRFSAKETQEYLREHRRLELSDSQIKRLHESTEGWAAALWLASMALKDKSDPDAFISQFSGSNAAVASYLAEDVLAGLPEDLRDFLMDISVLNEINEHLCIAVSGRQDSLNLLQELHRQNLFVQLVDEQQQQYSFHALFHDFLGNQLQKFGSERYRQLNKQAAKAYLKLNRPIPAIRHCIRSGEVDQAVALLNQNITSLLNDGRLRLLLRFLEELPKQVVQNQPELQLVRAWCIAFIKGPQESLTLLLELENKINNEETHATMQVLKAMLLGMMDRADEAHELGLYIFSQLTNEFYFANTMLAQTLTQTSIIMGEHNAARRFAGSSRGSISGGAGTFGAVLAESAEGLLDLMKGHLQQSISRLRHAMDSFASSSKEDSRGITIAALHLAEALYEAGNVDEAAKLLQSYSPLIQDIGPADALISAHVTYARILWPKDPIKANELLLELEDRGHALRLPRVIASARLQRANFFINNGNYDGANEELQLAESDYEWPNLHSRWYVANDTLTPEICRLRWQLRRGKANQTIAPLREAIKQADRTQHARRALKLRLLLAEALHEDGQRNLSRRTLGKAIQTIDQEGFISTLVEEGPILMGLVQELPTQQSDAVSHTLSESLRQRTQPTEKTSTTMPFDALTPKEMQVLTLLAEGLSNIAMSERLFVSESTVRTHLRSINLKLDAGNRTEAVMIARRAGLIK